MGLAPFGDPHEIITGQKSKTYIQVFRDIIKNKNKLSYEINKDWIAYHIKRDTWVSEKFKKMFGKVRKSGEKINQHHKNIAAALQLRLEEVVLDKLKFAKKNMVQKNCVSQEELVLIARLMAKYWAQKYLMKYSFNLLLGTLELR